MHYVHAPYFKKNQKNNYTLIDSLNQIGMIAHYITYISLGYLRCSALMFTISALKVRMHLPEENPAFPHSFPMRPTAVPL